MSRFKLYAIAQMMAAAIMGNRQHNDEEKKALVSDINRSHGGILFAGSSPYGPAKTLNQRQRRKRWRQSPHLRNR